MSQVKFQLYKVQGITKLMKQRDSERVTRL